jgi:hypothetical protein
VKLDGDRGIFIIAPSIIVDDTSHAPEDTIVPRNDDRTVNIDILVKFVRPEIGAMIEHSKSEDER